MFKSLAPVFFLLCSFCILCLGHGLQSVLLPARATIEHYSDTTLGILSASYFIGFITGTFTGPKLINRVGHIHVFAASAAGAAACMLCFPLILDPLAWIVLRFVYGLCLVQFYTVMEGWLNSISKADTRGKILSCYMILNFVAMSGGQMMFTQTMVGGYEMFSICALLICLSLIPLLLSRTQKPEDVHSLETFGLKQLYSVSPLGCIGAGIVGLMTGAYWGLTAPYILQIGFDQGHIAWFMAASMLGGLIAQWPLGALSDLINRRWVILLAATSICVTSALMITMTLQASPAQSIGTQGLLLYALLFGAGFHPLYSLCMAHTNDFVPSGVFVKASATLQLVQSSGAIIGSLLAGFLMQQGGPVMLYGYIGALSGLLVAITLSRVIKGRIPKYASAFRFMSRTGGNAAYMDPRS